MLAENLWIIVWADHYAPLRVAANPHTVDEGMLVFESESDAHAECCYLLMEQEIECRPVRLSEYTPGPTLEANE